MFHSETILIVIANVSIILYKGNWLQRIGAWNLAVEVMNN